MSLFNKIIPFQNTSCKSPRLCVKRSYVGEEKKRKEIDAGLVKVGRKRKLSNAGWNLFPKLST